MLKSVKSWIIVLLFVVCNVFIENGKWKGFFKLV